MRIRLLTMVLAAILLPLTFGCGGSESSYQDRQGDVDAETVDLQPPADMADDAGS